MRRNTLGASNRLLVEWTNEDRDMYKNHLMMSGEQFFELLSKVKPYMEKQDINMRECISAHVNTWLVIPVVSL
jgi:hypothetical protein